MQHGLKMQANISSGAQGSKNLFNTEGKKMALLDLLRNFILGLKSKISGGFF